MNSKWQLSRVGLVNFWYYDEEEFSFQNGRMLLRGANGSGKSVTMQSFIPLLLDGNMRPERLDPFGSNARKMENYLLEEGDEREERTGYLYMEMKRQKANEYITLGIGLRARKNKKMDSWYFGITDGRRIGIDIDLYKEQQEKIVYTKRELTNRIGEGGWVIESQREYADQVNRLLFGFETGEEYKELLDLLIQLRTPKLSKDFKPTVINEILSGSLQTLSEDDLRPMSEAIENMDSIKTNLDALQAGIEAAEQIKKVYDQYNEIVLCDKALLYQNACAEHRDLKERTDYLKQDIEDHKREEEQEIQHFEALQREMAVLQEERDSLAESDAAKLKEKEEKLKSQQEEIEERNRQKTQQEEDKKDKLRETEILINESEERCDRDWRDVEKSLAAMEEELQEIPYDDAAFLKKELIASKGTLYQFSSHIQIWKEYCRLVDQGKEKLKEERECRKRYSKTVEDLDRYREDVDQAERILRQHENQLHEIKQELIEKIYSWSKENQELQQVDDSVLQDMNRKIDGYRSGADYWEIRNLWKPVYDEKQRELGRLVLDQGWKIKVAEEALQMKEEELQSWRDKTDPEPECDEATAASRKALEEKRIPYLPFYKIVDFDDSLSEEAKGMLEEALLRMGVLDALIVSAEYREQVLKMGKGICDKYLFTDITAVQENLMNALHIDEEKNSILLYQKVARILSAIGWNEDKAGTWVDAQGNYKLGIIEGTVTKQYQPKYIGTLARKRHQQAMIRELEKVCEGQRDALESLREGRMQLQDRSGKLEKEWLAFPKEDDLKLAAREYERQEEMLEHLQGVVQKQREAVEKERAQLDTVSIQVQEICRKCELNATLSVFEDVLERLQSYGELLTALQICYARYVGEIEQINSQKSHLEDLEHDLDDIRYELGQIEQSRRKIAESLNSVSEQLKLTDYDSIKARLDHCIMRLQQIPEDQNTSAANKSRLQTESKQLEEKLEQTEQKKDDMLIRRDWLKLAFEEEYRLGYVVCEIPEEREQVSLENIANKICGMLSGKFGNQKQADLLGRLQEVYHRCRSALLEYQITLKTLFASRDEATDFQVMSMKRIDISGKYRGAAVTFVQLIRQMKEDAEVQKKLLSEKDRELFEDILSNTISKKIRAKILDSKRWVEKMNGLMESMQTSSGLTLSLRWKNKRAEKDDQLDTKALVELLQKDADIMRPEEAAQLSRHFRSKIEEARRVTGEGSNIQSFHAVMREILDYRQWFEFQLECQKTGEKKKELTNRVFFTFSGGEKAMAMYVPLFSAVVAKYAGARPDAPRLISLDEAFAGVDETNIRDMFRLMVEFDFNFMINSQILWGDYDTVPGLAIYQLIRPENVKYVTVIRYIWNGEVKRMLTGKEENLL